MYSESLTSACAAAKSKSTLSKKSIGAYLVHSAMAGAYVGLGIILIFALATPFAAAKLPGLQLIMGATFGIALSLVIIAGSDLFTGNTFVMPVAAMTGTVTWGDVFRVFAYSYVGNLFGSLLVAIFAYKGGVFGADPNWVLTVAEKKMNGGFAPLFFKGILCNWLVVLAVWSCFRVKSESAKLIMIWWCLLGFIGSGYEHSVANMTLLSLANFLPHEGMNISWNGFWSNLIPVTLGNIFSGLVLMGAAYFYIQNSYKDIAKTADNNSQPQNEKKVA